MLDIDKVHYIIMMKKLYKVMIDEYDEADALACAEDDWVLGLLPFRSRLPVVWVQI